MVQLERATRHTLVPLQLLERPRETTSSREAARLLVATPPPVTDGLTCRAGAAGRRVALSRCFASGAGEGPFDLVVAMGFVTHLDLEWQFPWFQGIRALGRACRVAIFDKRG